MEKETLLIADCLQLVDVNGQPSGHYWKTATQYAETLKEHFNVQVTASANYTDILNGYPLLPLKHTILDHQTGAVNKIKRLYKLFANMFRILNSKSSKVIIQAVDIFALCLCLLFYFGGKEIYLIRYDNLSHKSELKRFVYRLISRKIKGVISGLEDSMSSYQREGIVIPDYLFFDTAGQSVHKEKYDFVTVGIIRDDKNIEDIVDSFINTPYRVCIAGRFVDNNRYEAIKPRLTDNIEVINSYISEEQYNELLESSKFVILPYKSSYNSTSSGVVFDSLYKYKPVITSNVACMQFIRSENLGFVYQHSVREYLQFMESRSMEGLLGDYKVHITSYIARLDHESKNKLIYFIKGQPDYKPVRHAI
ncbi:glycosyltransferase [Paenibacillus sedimenti]|uniref:Glycosyltransferase n=1 Tax=Paenibacillus sedimenti TaxID=2770274 RepID=A0A926QIX0_9BACL|nr:glycosyltransferase [Paenibacillus sedimenti]MBD0379782.1 glycosyltransferase [Paenibacillus sedimenti]